MSLKNTAIKGFFWMTSNMSLMFVISLVKIFILARYLSTDEIGILSILLFLNSLLLIISELGIGNVIVQKQEVSQTNLSSLFWLRVIVSVCLYFILFLTAWMIASFYNEPRLEFVIKISSITIIFMNISDFFRIVCQKDLNFKVIAMISIFSEIVGLALMYFFLIQGYTLNAAICGILITAFMSSVLYYIYNAMCSRLPSFIMDANYIVHYLKPSSYQMGEKLFNYFSSNLDKILIGKFLGLNALGIYELAWKLMIAPVRQLNPIINNISFPIYSKLKDHRLKQDIYINIMRFLGLISIPFFLYISLKPSLVVLVLFGQGWERVAEILPAMLLVGVIKMLTNPTGAYTMSNNRFDLTFNWNILSFIVLLSFLLSVFYLAPSLENVAITLLIANILIGLIIHTQVAIYFKLKYYPIIKNIFLTLALGILCKFLTDILIIFSQINKDYVNYFFVIIYFFLYFLFAYTWNYKLIKSFLRN